MGVLRVGTGSQIEALLEQEDLNLSFFTPALITPDPMSSEHKILYVFNLLCSSDFFLSLLCVYVFESWGGGQEQRKRDKQTLH